MGQIPKAELAHAALLEAAGSLVATKGALLLTLDAVAKDAGISKGGLLHHFPTKESLLVALADRELQGYHRLLLGLRQAAQSIGLALDRATIHLLTCYLQISGSKACDVRADILAGLMPAVSVTPELAQHMSAFYQSLFAEIKQDHKHKPRDAQKSGEAYADAVTRILAAEGWFMLQLHGVHVFSRDDEMRVMNGLIQGLGLDQKKIMKLIEALESSSSNLHGDSR